MAANPPTQIQTAKPGNGEIRPFRDKMETLRLKLEKMGPQLAMALPKHIKADRMQRVALTAVQRNPKLLDCEPTSFLLCVLQCAQLGLEPDGLLGQAYLIPFRDHRNNRTICTMVAGYKGLLKLARNSGQIASIEAHVVRVGDEFRYRFGTKSFLRHHPADAPLVERKEEPGVIAPDPGWMPGTVTHVYAVAKLKDGTSQFEVMPTHEINWVRDASAGYQYALDNKRTDNPWMTDWPEMAKKTVIRRFTKVLPASVELQTASALDEQADLGLPQMFADAIDVTATETAATQEPAAPAAAPTQPFQPTGTGSKLDDLAAAAKAKREAEGNGGAPIPPKTAGSVKPPARASSEQIKALNMALGGPLDVALERRLDWVNGMLADAGEPLVANMTELQPDVADTLIKAAKNNEIPGGVPR